MESRNEPSPDLFHASYSQLIVGLLYTRFEQLPQCVVWLEMIHYVHSLDSCYSSFPNILILIVYVMGQTR